MKYCVRCCQSDSRPKIWFREDGVCGACVWEEEKASINWTDRKHELEGIAWRAKDKAEENDTYDCVVGCSGGKDTTFTALYSRDVLHLNCLLVNAMPAQITEIGQHNIDNLVSQGFDILKIGVNPIILKALIKRDFYKYGNISKPTEYPLWASAYHVAERYNIPLVIQGENAALTLGAREGFNLDGDASQIFKNNTLAGGDAYKEYIGEWFGVKVEKKDLLLYQFPKFDTSRRKAIWLNYYVPEWSQLRNAEFSARHGLWGRNEPVSETGLINWGASLDSDFYMVNQMLKYYKFGFGSATDHVCYQIREGQMGRQEGFEWLKSYDGHVGQRYIENFCRYIDITLSEFWRVVDGFVNKELFHHVNGKWQRKFKYPDEL